MSSQVFHYFPFQQQARFKIKFSECDSDVFHRRQKHVARAGRSFCASNYWERMSMGTFDLCHREWKATRKCLKCKWNSLYKYLCQLTNSFRVSECKYLMHVGWDFSHLMCYGEVSRDFKQRLCVLGLGFIKKDTSLIWQLRNLKVWKIILAVCLKHFQHSETCWNIHHVVKKFTNFIKLLSTKYIQFTSTHFHFSYVYDIVFYGMWCWNVPC